MGLMEAKMVDDWMTLYERAWRSPGADMLNEIFTEDVRYKVSPFKEPMQGLDALQRFWKEKRDGPDEAFTMTHEMIALEGDTAVVRVDVQYESPAEHWKDLWILSFASDGRCNSFEEWPFKEGQDDGHN